MERDDDYIDVYLRWVNIDKIKPPENEWVLGSNPKRTEMGIWNGTAFCCPDQGYREINITHWAEIPRVPTLFLKDEK
ncbi:MAG: hypothetical protein KAS32_31620 [Candidatus Peribacteraceae bacterium]|nr:hypothetical protein [Candidatus Peribacteraceae bacterium]